MRLAIISDIHANLEALTAVLADIDLRSMETIVCLGDIVGYGASPRECIELVRERSGVIVMGNHDEAAFNRKKWRDFSKLALAAMKWTEKQLSVDDKSFLMSLPLKMSKDGHLFVHANPKGDNKWEYIVSALEARMYDRYFKERLCFIGHTHIPNVFAMQPDVYDYSTTGRFLINVGSVGQPRDRNWRACYGILDTVAGSFELIRVEYDIDTASEKILDAGLPRRLADRLFIGG